MLKRNDDRIEKCDCKWQNFVKKQYEEDEETLSDHAVLGEGWRDVRRELPDKLYHCLIFYCEDWNFDKTWKIGFCFVNSDGEFCIENSKVEPTHWMPLPDPPSFV